MTSRWRAFRARPPRVQFAYWTLGVCGLSWPVVGLMIWLGVPIFEQVMIGLSFMAPMLTAVNVLFTAEVQEHQNGSRS